MKKIERLRWVESNFGPDFVLKYFICHNWQEIEKAISYFEKRNLGWGMRTDRPTTNNNEDDWNLPFLFRGTINEAQSIWRKHEKNFNYIVCKNITEVYCHGVAELIAKQDGLVFIKYNEKEKNISQRQMYNFPSNLEHIYVSPFRHTVRNELIIRCFYPHESFITDRSFDIIYRLFFFSDCKEKEITFTVLPDKKIVIW